MLCVHGLSSAGVCNACTTVHMTNAQHNRVTAIMKVDGKLLWGKGTHLLQQLPEPAAASAWLPPLQLLMSAAMTHIGRVCMLLHAIKRYLLVINCA